MMRQLLLRSAFALGLALLPSVALAQAPTALPPTQDRQALEAAIARSSRKPANILRDRYRHPLEPLTFFGVRNDSKVVEVWPGGGWYTEILAPYLKARGTYVAAATPKGLGGISALMTASPEVYGTLLTAILPATPSDAKVEDGSADFVLTFRNVHNWLMGEEPIADEMFRQMFAMLKPGGVLGVEDHRLPESADAGLEKTSGYVKIESGPQHPPYGEFCIAGGHQLGFNDLKTIEMGEFLRAIGEGRKSTPDFREAYEIQKVVEAALASSKSRAWIRVA
jgi:predicted methyltransferase